MIRRNFLKGFSLLGLSGEWFTSDNFVTTNKITSEIKTNCDREYWVNMLVQVTEPVLVAAQQDRLREIMPVECQDGAAAISIEVSHLEALARSLAGLAPWLELGSDSTKEGQLRHRIITLAQGAIKNAVTPSAKSYMNFTKHSQPLVDAAFLSHAMLRAPTQLWENLGQETQQLLIEALLATRAIKPYDSNWLLFSAIVETALLKFTNNFDISRIDYALKSHEDWYQGDGVYGDGPNFHFDYYNSFVIHPMLVDIADVLEERNIDNVHLASIKNRAQRYAVIQERMISPEGTFPPIGRSLAYRCGAFQLLAQLALQKRLPDNLTPGQVRGALSAVIERTLEAPGTFDKKGWLTIGLAGHQPGIGEYYISTGSLYLCTVAFLPLGLPPEDLYWTSPLKDWTSKKAFSGKPFTIDAAIK